ncbi:hypothetical protein K9L97_02090 [Candidatus Woesearchaeota archaeon]|nr:hypothetical protein [Candidatus Woesearchaeota archaeon]
MIGEIIGKGKKSNLFVARPKIKQPADYIKPEGLQLMINAYQFPQLQKGLLAEYTIIPGDYKTQRAIITKIKTKQELQKEQNSSNFYDAMDQLKTYFNKKIRDDLTELNEKKYIKENGNSQTKEQIKEQLTFTIKDTIYFNKGHALIKDLYEQKDYKNAIALVNDAKEYFSELMVKTIKENISINVKPIYLGFKDLESLINKQKMQDIFEK